MNKKLPSIIVIVLLVPVIAEHGPVADGVAATCHPRRQPQGVGAKKAQNTS